MTLYAANRVHTLLERNSGRSYLEIGVREGSTFLHVNAGLKVGVDPKFTFDVTQYVNEHCHLLDITSDEFFGEYCAGRNGDKFRDAGGNIAWDVIFIDGLHTFQQSFKDFQNSLKFAHDNTFWLLDDTVPTDVFATHDDPGFSTRYRKAAGGRLMVHQGGVFKVLSYIHDHHPELSYCTIIGTGNPQTILWKTGTPRKSRPVYSKSKDIAAYARISYLDMLNNAKIHAPVSEEEYPALLGTTIEPLDFSPEDSAERLIFVPFKTVQEEKYSYRQKELKKEITLLQEENAKLRKKNGTDRALEVPFHELAEERTVKGPSSRPKQNNIIIYTCIMGKYDRLEPLSTRMEGARYVCISDDRSLKSDFWDIQYYNNQELSRYDNTLKNRYVKLMPHLLFKEYEFSLYIDGNVDIISHTAYEKIRRYMENGISFVNAKHYKRNCMYDEAVACIKLKKDTTENIQKWLTFLDEQNFPKAAGLYANSLLFRKHNEPSLQKLADDWWNILISFSKRDQLSLPFLVQKHGITCHDWNEGMTPAPGNFFCHCNQRPHEP